MVGASWDVFEDDHRLEEKVINYATEPFDNQPWWVILPGSKDHSPLMDFYGGRPSSARSCDLPWPRWVASAVQFEDARIVQSVVDSVLLNV